MGQGNRGPLSRKTQVPGSSMKGSPRIFFRPERCMSCLSCRFACQTEAAAAAGGRPSERMTLTFHQGTPWIWKCQQCVSAPCVEACVSGSLRQEPDGVIHTPERCVGCGSCALVCPFGAIRPEGRDRMTKCNLCREEPVPPCIKACLTQALVLAEPTRFARMKTKAFALELRKRSGIGNERT
jgi:carbon-monoxide dehydrogenase iron sulfur subunit